MAKRKRKKFVPAKASAGAGPKRGVPEKATKGPEHSLDAKPSWRFIRIDFEGPWTWHNATKDHLIQIHKRFKSIEQASSWRDVLDLGGARKTGSHYIARSELGKDAQQRLEGLNLDDFDEICSLRIGQAERVWGVIIEGVFHVIWWDPDHLVYPMNVTGN